MAIRKEGGRHPRRGRRGELLSHEGECSVEVAAGLLAGGWRRHGWKERGSRWGRKIFFSFLAWLRGEEGRTVGGRGAEKRIKWHPRVRVRVWRKPARGQTRGATSNLLAIDPRLIFWTRTHTRRVSGGSRVPAGLKPDSYKQCTEYQIQVTKSASATTTSPEPLQCNNRRLIRGQIAAPNLPKAFRCNHQSIMFDSGSSYQ